MQSTNNSEAVLLLKETRVGKRRTNLDLLLNKNINFGKKLKLKNII